MLARTIPLFTMLICFTASIAVGQSGSLQTIIKNPADSLLEAGYRGYQTQSTTTNTGGSTAANTSIDSPEALPFDPGDTKLIDAHPPTPPVENSTEWTAPSIPSAPNFPSGQSFPSTQSYPSAPGFQSAPGVTSAPPITAPASGMMQSVVDSETTTEMQYEVPEFFGVLDGLEAGETNQTCEKVTRRIPVVVEESIAPGKDASDKKFEKLSFFAGYKKGFAFLPKDKKKTPFDLTINGWIQFRHVGFTRDVDSWTDNAGVTRDVRNRNAFDIERARISFKGSALDERLTYFYQLDGDTDGRHTVDFFDYWWSWKFSDDFRVQFGKRKVSASRQWLLGARRTRFIDRPLSNDFFRPDRTIGLWGIGKTERFKYEVMVGNGYRTANIPNSATDDQLTFAATQSFDLGGDYGKQIVDFDNTDKPLVRFGHSFVYSPVTSESLGSPNNETDFLRLTDGTRLNQTGALAPGVTVSGANVLFYGVDLGVKYRGWSFNSEVFLRWIDDLEGDGALPVENLAQHGFYVEGGRFLIPKKLDLNFRYSEVDGLFGNGSELAAGVNWFPLDTHQVKCSFDVTVLDGSPLNNTSSEILAGDDGVLFRTQIQAEF